LPPYIDYTQFEAIVNNLFDQFVKIVKLPIDIVLK